MLYWLCEFLQAMAAIETGVAYGWSSLAMPLSLKDRPGARLVSVDMPHVGMNNDEYAGRAVPDSPRGHWTLLKTSDRQGVPAGLRQFGPIDISHMTATCRTRAGCGLILSSVPSGYSK